MDKQYAFGEVKAVTDSTQPNGEFEVILSMPTLDRDGEIVDARAFEPLPESLPFHAFHNFSDPIGRARPYYDGDVLKARGFFASTPRAQEIRQLVADGIISHTSVGFMPPIRDMKDGGVPHIVKGELLEGSFVSVPSNRDAMVLSAKAGARNSADDATRLQQIHDLTVENGAACKGVHVHITTPKGVDEPAATDPEEKAAAPAAADPPADVTVGMARLAAARAQLLLL